MTYFTFLAIFVGLPTLLFIAINWIDQRHQLALPTSLASWPPRIVLLAHVLVAILYTTPWDNYLVATRVWWYDPNLVAGIVLGWVPLEEYIFFTAQTVMVSLWLWIVARRLYAQSDSHLPSARFARRLRWGSATLFGLIWLWSVYILATGWRPGTYLGLELVWALPPIAFQCAFGADILWRYRRLVALTLLPTTVYLAWADTFAIGNATWTIDPAQSTGILIGPLPVEELIFFFLTCTLVVFGTVLVLAHDSQSRAPHAVLEWLQRFSSRQRSQQKRSLSNV